MAAPTTLNVNHPALAPWKQTFTKNANGAKDEGEVQKAQAVTDFVLSQRDPAYAKAKQTATDAPVKEESAGAPTGMADGGVVPERKGKQFNTSMADKLKEFLMHSKENDDDAQSR
jgi:hypothetical protein